MQGGLLGNELHGVLHAQGKLLADELVALAGVALFFACGEVFVLRGIGVLPCLLDGFVEGLGRFALLEAAVERLEAGFLDGALVGAVVEQGDGEGEAHHVVPAALELLAEAQVAGRIVPRPGGSLQADGGEVAGLCDFLVELGGLCAEFPGFYLGHEGERRGIDLFLVGQEGEHGLVGNLGERQLHFFFAASDFEQLPQLELIVGQLCLRLDELVGVGAELRLHLGHVDLRHQAVFFHFLRPAELGGVGPERGAVGLHGLGGIEDLQIGLRDGQYHLVFLLCDLLF